MDNSHLIYLYGFLKNKKIIIIIRERYKVVSVLFGCNYNNIYPLKINDKRNLDKKTTSIPLSRTQSHQKHNRTTLTLYFVNKRMITKERKGTNNVLFS